MNAEEGRITGLERVAAGTGSTAADYYRLAGVKLQQGDLDGAITAYRCSLEAGPVSAAIYNNLGAALLQAGRFDTAVAALTAAVELQPGYLRALVNLGKALRQTGRPAEAVTCLREALAIDEHYLPALINCGDALAATDDLDGARDLLEDAIRAAPASVEAHVSLGIVHLQARRLAQAVEFLHRALALDPHHPNARLNLAHVLAATGDWQAAWPHFEYRFRRTASSANPCAPGRIARWDGSLAPRLRLWLLGEQGLGDQLQFVRYVKVLAERGVACTLVCDPRLHRVLGDARLGARIVASIATDEDPHARCFPLLSLPLWHGTSTDRVPFAAGYLAADPARVAGWRSRLPGPSTLRVALTWAGNPRMETGHHIGRSPPLGALAPLLAVQQVSFISLQKGFGEEQIDHVPFGPAIMRLQGLDCAADAFLDTAAVLRCVDLLVTSDTAIAHLAGGLGVPTWLCLKYDPDWRWGLSGETTPWYASLRIFRQTRAGDWAGVYQRIARDLAVRAAGGTRG